MGEQLVYMSKTKQGPPQSSVGPILIQMEKMQVAKKCCQSLKQSRAGLSRLVSALKQIQAGLKQLVLGFEAN